MRESSSSVGDYVLSVLFQGEVIHYQIRKHGEDAFFSIGKFKKIILLLNKIKNLHKINSQILLLDDETTIHGLDTLIEYYQEDSHGLETKLVHPCKGNSPPHDTRRHGRTNLLHRATIQV